MWTNRKDVEVEEGIEIEISNLVNEGGKMDEEEKVKEEAEQVQILMIYGKIKIKIQTINKAIQFKGVLGFWGFGVFWFDKSW